jgi:DNA-binding transcriptional LysR family regulator
MDRLMSMAVFVKAVDLGSFAAAAAALDLSSPMIGKHVRLLEERLGVRLLNRTTRRQSLTDFGSAYYERCRLVLSEADAADALAADHLSEPCGKLRVAMPILLGRHCVTPILLELSQRYPRLELDLSYSDRITDLVEERYDLAIRTGTLEDRVGMTARRLARQPMMVCAAPSYLDIHGAPLKIEDISEHQSIVYRRSGPVPPWLFPRADQPPLTVTPISRLRFDDMEAIANAACAGMGLAWLPYWLVREHIQRGALVPVLQDQSAYLYDCHAVWLQIPRLPMKVRLAVDALASGLPKLMR